MEKEAEIKEPDMNYTRELRKATRDVHKMSDILINAKFALALSDEAVWADGLLAFYEIYKYFEAHLPEEFLPKELHRREAFEKDLNFFLGSNWQENYEPRDSVKKYLDKLEEARLKSNVLLFAYAFQMYMALMSGGQLLQKKRMVARKLWIFSNHEEETEEKNDKSSNVINDDLENRPMPAQVTQCPIGCAATYFTQDIKTLKAKLRTILNKNYGQFDDDMRAAFIEESRNVFYYNGEVVRTIKGVNKANMRKLGMFLVIAVGLYIALKIASF